MELRIYGSSDDLIEIEGDFIDELNVYDDTGFIVLSDGTIIKYEYDGDWFFSVKKPGPKTVAVVHPIGNDLLKHDYSELVDLQAEEEFEWAALAQKVSGH